MQLSLKITLGMIVCAAGIALVALLPLSARASILDQIMYGICHDHVDNNDNGLLDLLDSTCDTVENTSPEALDQALTTDQDVAVTTTLTGTDNDSAGSFSGDVLYFTISMLPSHGTLMCGANSCNTLDSVVGDTTPNGVAPSVTYTPNSGFSGDDEFDFTASDGLLENDATVTIHVTATSTPQDPTCTENQTLTNHVCVDNENNGGQGGSENGGGSGGGNGGGGGSSNPQCSDGIDNDNDGRTDYPLDNSCSDAGDNTEGNDGGGGGGGSFVPFIPTGGSNGGGGGSTGGGVVLGTSTSLTCAPLLGSYVGWGRKNNAEDVMKLQAFLIGNLNINLDVNGVFDKATLNAVNAFQIKHWEDVLLPWKQYGLGDHEATGYVYKTTSYKINKLVCDGTFTDPFPVLP